MQYHIFKIKTISKDMPAIHVDTLQSHNFRHMWDIDHFCSEFNTRLPENPWKYEYCKNSSFIL